MDRILKKDKPKLTTQEKQALFYRRNYLALLSDALFFSLGSTLFSTDNVLALYVSNLSEKPIYIALMTALFFGFQYGASVLSCVIGVNARSPKWISIGVCFLQRVGFAIILLSTFFLKRSVSLALLLFFVSLVLYAISYGMSSPLFTQMVTFSIHKNIGSFFGVYYLVCNFSGVLATSFFAYCISRFVFPMNFRVVFLFGTVMATMSTITLSIFLREVTDERVREHILFRDVFRIGIDIFRADGKFRRFALTRAIAGAVEFTVPYYILYAGTLPNLPDGFLGIMATIYLVAKMLGSAVFGKIADKFGVLAVLRGGCVCGLAAALLSITVTDYRMAYVFYAILAFSTISISMSNQIASVEYSKGVRTPFYAAIIGIMCSPVAIITSLCGAALASRFSYKFLFAIAIVIYVIALFSSYFLNRKNNALT